VEAARSMFKDTVVRARPAVDPQAMRGQVGKDA
jgi:hypothetical protein